MLSEKLMEVLDRIQSSIRLELKKKLAYTLVNDVPGIMMLGDIGCGRNCGGTCSNDCSGSCMWEGCAGSCRAECRDNIYCENSYE